MTDTPDRPTQTAEAPPENATAPGPDLEARLAEAQAEIARLKDEFLRAKAETENVRRRAVEDVAKAHRFSLEGFATTLLPVRDSLEAALAVENATLESLREGVEITGRQLGAAFEKAGLAPVDPAGERFDPNFHQAISQAESDQPAQTVVAVLQKGYRLHERVIRPALVVVSTGRPTPPAGEAAPAA